jgi:hypothetical protein
MDMILCFLNANFSYLYNSEKDIKLIKKNINILLPFNVGKTNQLNLTVLKTF